jgi:hypothetical protein
VDTLQVGLDLNANGTTYMAFVLRGSPSGWGTAFNNGAANLVWLTPAVAPGSQFLIPTPSVGSLPTGGAPCVVTFGAG